MSAELGLAIVATVDICFKYGKELQKVCASFRGAPAELTERIVRLENGWLRYMTQLDFLRRVAHVMSDDHRELHEQTLRVFLSKLENVTAMLRRLTKTQATTVSSSTNGDVSDVDIFPRKLKYAFKKESLDKAIDELETWQRVADPSWFLLLRMADGKLDAELASPDSGTAASIPSTLTIRASLRDTSTTGTTGSGITLPPEALARMTISPIPFSDAKTAQVTHSSSRTTYILNHIDGPPPPKYHMVKKDVRDLAARLQHDEPHTFGLLSCKGFVTEVVSDSETEARVVFTMVFRTPAGLSRPRSLRDILINTPPTGSLSLRFDIARELARSVSYVHTFGFVHKNVRPDSILNFTSAADVPGSPSSSSSSSSSFFLVGFENFRREEGSTRRQGDDVPERNLYRHPSRQGASPEEDYIMQHDIYSLGVCLLEVGLWESFFTPGPAVTHDDPAKDDVDDSEESEKKGLNMVPSALFDIPRDATAMEVRRYLLTEGKDCLVALARTRLPRCMGTKYAEVVQTCLTCLDPENEDFGDEKEFEDEDGIRVGVRYIEKILLRLNMLYV